MLGAMSPQHSNRGALIEGTLTCFEDSPSARITARQIASASGANLASIKYHFGSTEALMGLALEEGFRRWLKELVHQMGDVESLQPIDRIKRASEVIADSVVHRGGLVRAFFAAVARAPHDENLRASLANSYGESVLTVARLLGLGDDEDAVYAATLTLATFDGLLIQSILNPERPINLEHMQRGLTRLFESAASG
jgi:AcrR family transcriptional regulator